MNHVSPFRTAGVMSGRKVWTRKVTVAFDGKQEPSATSSFPKTRFLRSSSSAISAAAVGVPQGPEARGADGGERPCVPLLRRRIPFPDRTDIASRTILTGEGGTSPSRFKHIVNAMTVATAGLRRSSSSASTASTTAGQKACPTVAAPS